MIDMNEQKLTEGCCRMVVSDESCRRLAAAFIARVNRLEELGVTPDIMRRYNEIKMKEGKR
jgi:hypothetical protein